MSDSRNSLDDWNRQLDNTRDSQRLEAVARRRSKGYRTARENLDAVCDPDSFTEYGQLAVAAQRGRRSLEELRAETPADGVITGIGSVNEELFGEEASRAAIVINDYTVLAGTQGFFHHQKIDRILEVARRRGLPVILFAEGGGGRPGDVDVKIANSGLTVPTFGTWASLSGVVPRIAVAHGYCFAGNAALFGSADITVATRSSWIGMAGPAMIEGGGLGTFKPTEIGPVEVQAANGVVDLVVEDEAAAAHAARQLLSYFQGCLGQGGLEGWAAADQDALREALPADRRYSYKIRPIIERLVDEGSFLELRQHYGKSVITGLARLEGRPVGLLANDTRALSGALDAAASEKAARFLQLLDAFGLPVISLCDTPGFMVGPESEEQAAVRRMSRLFVVGAQVRTPWLCVFLRKGYGLGAMAMAGGSLHRPDLTVAWPQGEFGAMGLEGAVHLGFKRELATATEGPERDALFQKLVGDLYDKGKAVEAAAFLELDAVIDPADTRSVLVRALRGAKDKGSASPHRFVDTW
ncbi:MAG: carboxyl transferase domain-containing protein [Acidobacteriota bacterium]